MSHQLDAKTAKTEAEAAYKLAHSYRDSDAAKAILAYLDARVAYGQAALLDAPLETLPDLQRKTKTLRELRAALMAEDGVPCVRV